MVNKKTAEEIRINEERIAFALESNEDGVWDWNIETDEMYYSKSWRVILGFEDSTNGMEKNDDWSLRIHPDDRAHVLKTLNDHLAGLTPSYNCEYRLQMKDDIYIWLHDRGKVVQWSADGKPTRAIGTDTNITSRKNMEIALSQAIEAQQKREEEILFISFHDELTGLYNRRFLNGELIRLNTEDQLPLSIVIGDINGLKLTNDVFGHLEGDEILISAADIMKRIFREDDIIARWGGDEFIILLPRTNEEIAEKLCKRMKQACQHQKSKTMMTSISLGYATKTDLETDIMHVLKKAEDHMYTSKLLESRSLRSSVVASMKRSLHEKSHETEKHADRLKKFCRGVAISMQVPDMMLDELELLSVLHDIGKIAIKDEILNKPSALNEVEWLEMKRHSEIGYHIAKSAPELSQIAEYILCHHEKWDGTGYPRGLKGTDIPLFSRILAVADAFDAMTSDRPYRKAMNTEEARHEIIKNTGSQFDPEVVRHFLKIV